MKKEIRSFKQVPSLSGRTISGYAIVFNSRSEVMFDEGRWFIEVIKPEAITKHTLLDSDIKMTVEHNRERLLARSNKGTGSLHTEITSKGVMYSFEAPPTPDGDFATAMISRGDIQGSSFAFHIAEDGDTWEREGDIWLRTITKIYRLYDMTLTADPAYSETSAEVRNFLNKERPLNLNWANKLYLKYLDAGIEPSQSVIEKLFERG